MKKVQFTETALRDASQSLVATRHHRRPRRPVGEGKEADAEIIPHPASAPAGLSERPRWP